MSGRIDAQIVPQGLLIPYDEIREWLEHGVEVTREQERIIIQPRSEPSTERERVLQILQNAGLLLPQSSRSTSHKPLSAEEKEELAQKFSVGTPLSEIVIRDRADRA
jgi:hypothetical protein